MTYNILNGGVAGLERIIEVVKKESPDYLTINEANTFARENTKGLKEFAHQCGFEYCQLALSGEKEYHVAACSKKKWQSVKHVTPLMRGCVVAEFKTTIGDLSIASFHLTPYTEDLRLPEIDVITSSQRGSENKVLIGDANSLSPYDDYNPAIVKTFNEIQIKKFTKDGQLRFDAIKKIMSYGYLDCALELKSNRDYTAPTSINEGSVHSNMRLDYFFISKSVRPYLHTYYVVKNSLTQIASDHYPVVIELRGVEVVD